MIYDPLTTHKQVLSTIQARKVNRKPLISMMELSEKSIDFSMIDTSIKSICRSMSLTLSRFSGRQKGNTCFSSNDKIKSKGEKQCCASKAYRSYSSARKVQNTVRHAHVTHRISAGALRRITTVAHYSNVTLRRSSKKI